MNPQRALLLLLLVTACGGAAAPEDVQADPSNVVVSARSVRVRVAGYNVQALEPTRSDAFVALAQIVGRISADVLCLQEVGEEEQWRLASLARGAGYEHVFMGEVSSAMAGGLTNACLSRLPLLETWSASSVDLSSDTRAVEVGRDIVAVRVEVAAGSSRQLLVVDLHLKSGFSDADRFRRQVEITRALQLVARNQAAHPDDAVVVLGDFNEEIDGPDLGQRFTWFPSGLPRSYFLGADIRFPIVYDPFTALAEAGFWRTNPSHEDAPEEHATRIPSGKRIDFLFLRQAWHLRSEVYEACVDDGIDAAPRGDGIAKVGEPLPCGTSLRASDHRPVVADVRIYRR